MTPLFPRGASLRPGAHGVVLCTALGALFVGGCAGSGGARPKMMDPEAEVTASQERLVTAPDDIEAWFRLGMAWQARADAVTGAEGRAFRDSARVAYDALLERDPENVRGLVHRGLVLEDLNKPAEALLDYEKAARLAPEDPLPQINIGSLLYFQYRKTFEAKNALTKAIELDPDNADAHFNLGVMFADASLFQEAAREWKRVLELDADGQAGRLASENLERIRPVLEAAENDAAGE